MNIVGVPETVGFPKFPVWLKLKRYGDQISLSYSWDGSYWDNRIYSAGVTVKDLSSTIQIGLFTTSETDGTLATGSLSNVSVTPLVIETPTHYFGNSHPGSDHTPFGVYDMFVTENGMCYVTCADENKHYSIGFDSNGDKVFEGFEGNLDDPRLVTADDTYVYNSLRDGGVRRFYFNGWRKEKTPALSQHIFTGLAADSSRGWLYGSHDNSIEIYNRETLASAGVGTISLARAGAMCIDVDNNLLVVQLPTDTSDGSVWKYQPSTDTLSQFVTFGAISEKVNPVDISVDPINGFIHIADNGPLQQVHYFRPHNSSYAGSFGDAYGIRSGISGRVAPKKFSNINSLGLDSSGAMYVACRGQKHHGAMQLRKFNSSRNVVWERFGLEFVDAGDFDPSDPAVVYTRNHRYEMNYDTNQWTFIAETFDEEAYPDDPRAHFNHSECAAAIVRRIEGERILFITGQTNGHLYIYRFESGSEVAIPCGWIQAKSNKDHPADAPANDWIWIDDDGDGQIDDGYEQTSIEGSSLDGWVIDDNGDIWTGNSNRIQRLACQGFNTHGAPIYTGSGKTDWTLSSSLTDVADIRNLQYDSSTDTMIVTGYSNADPFDTDFYHFRNVGRDMSRINNFSTSPSNAWNIRLPGYGRGGNAHDSFNITSVAAAGDYIFASLNTIGETYAINASNGAIVDTIRPGPEIAGYVGILDICLGMSAAYLSGSNEYLILIEEDARAKNIIYRWSPPIGNQNPYNGSAASIPGRIEAEKYDTGGEGVAYHDTSSGNSGGDFRSEDVDIQTCSEGGYNVGWTANGEWLEYAVNCTAGTYNMMVSTSTPNTGKSLRVKLGDGPDGANFVTLGTFAVPDTNGWQNWQTVTLNNISISGSGQKVLRLEIIGGSFNIDWVEFTSAGGATDEKLNCGGAEISEWQSDTGGNTYSNSSSINTSGVTNPAPQEVYQSERYGDFGYSFTGLQANGSYTVRLHFAELYWSASGKRVMDVYINNSLVLNDYDVYAEANNTKLKAVIEEFSVSANSSGVISVDFVSVTDNAKCSGIELIPD